MNTSKETVLSEGQEKVLKNWGLIYKTVRRIDVKRLRMHKTQKVHVLRRFPFLNQNPI